MSGFFALNRSRRAITGRAIDGSDGPLFYWNLPETNADSEAGNVDYVLEDVDTDSDRNIFFILLGDIHTTGNIRFWVDGIQLTPLSIDRKQIGATRDGIAAIFGRNFPVGRTLPIRVEQDTGGRGDYVVCALVQRGTGATSASAVSAQVYTSDDFFTNPQINHQVTTPADDCIVLQVASRVNLDPSPELDAVDLTRVALGKRRGTGTNGLPTEIRWGRTSGAATYDFREGAALHLATLAIESNDTTPPLI